MALNRISDRTSFATLRTRANMATPMMGFVDDREETRGNREISSQILFSEPWTRDWKYFISIADSVVREYSNFIHLERSNK